MHRIFSIGTKSASKQKNLATIQLQSAGLVVRFARSYNSNGLDLGNYGLRVEFRWCLSFSFYHRVHSFDGQMNLHKLLYARARVVAEQIGFLAP